MQSPYTPVSHTPGSSSLSPGSEASVASPPRKQQRGPSRKEKRLEKEAAKAAQSEHGAASASPVYLEEPEVTTTHGHQQQGFPSCTFIKVSDMLSLPQYQQVAIPESALAQPRSLEDELAMAQSDLQDANDSLDYLRGKHDQLDIDNQKLRSELEEANATLQAALPAKFTASCVAEQSNAQVKVLSEELELEKVSAEKYHEEFLYAQKDHDLQCECYAKEVELLSMRLAKQMGKAEHFEEQSHRVESMSSLQDEQISELREKLLSIRMAAE